MDSRNFFCKVAGIIGLSGIALGAFGAHALKDSLSSAMMAVYQTGVLYHMIHSVALLAMVLGNDSIWASPWAKRVCMAWVVGIILFSGSLYLLAITDIKGLGAITPFGGLAFMAGWLMVAFLYRQTSE